MTGVLRDLWSGARVGVAFLAFGHLAATGRWWWIAGVVVLAAVIAGVQTWRERRAGWFGLAVRIITNTQPVPVTFRDGGLGVLVDSQATPAHQPEGGDTR